MKILLLGPEADSLLRFRGPLIEDWEARGHKVVLGAPPASPSVLSAIRKAGLGFKALPLDRAGMHPLRDLRFLFHLRGLLKWVQPDILFLTTIKPVLYGSLAARFWHSGPCYSMITGAGSLFMGNSPGKLLARALALPLFRAGLARNQAVFFQNPDDLDLFTRTRLLADPSQAVRIEGSGVPLDEFPRKAVPSGPPRFLFVGRLLKEKGLPEFVGAAGLLKPRYPKARFHVLGELDENPGSVTREQVEAWKGSGSVEFLGKVADVRKALAACTVFVLPSYYREGVPRSILEALSTGRAVVTTDAPGCRETVREGKNGFLVPLRDEAALARAMERFLVDRSLARRFGAASRALAVKRFDVRKVNRTILKAMGMG